MSDGHILVLGGLAQSLTNFRGPLIKALRAAGYSVTAAAADDNPEVAATLKNWGVRFRPVMFERTGMNPLSDFACLLRFRCLMQEVKPVIFFGYTIKPVIYGLMAAKWAGIPHRYGMIEGLGYPFTGGDETKRRIARIVGTLGFRIALRGADTVIVLNADDEAFLLNRDFVRTGHTAKVDGTGIDLAYYRQAPLPSGPVTFLLIARLLRDKGIYEYIEAARLVKRGHAPARFLLVGPLDSNPAAVRPRDVDALVREGIVEYLGELHDVRPAITACHVFVLPSYCEGLPRTIVEAMAMGRAVITTDVPGCRETVIPGRNGFLVPARDPQALAGAMITLLNDEGMIRRMGEESLNIARQRFDADVVCRNMLQIITRSAA